MNYTKIFRIGSYVLTALALIYLIITYVIGSFLLSFSQDYRDFDDYQTLTVTIDSIYYYEDSVNISPENSSYYLDGENDTVAINNGIQSGINIGDQVTLTIGKKGWGDSWDYPIVMIEKEGTVYLDYETGVNNIIAKVDTLKKEFYKSLILPGSLFIITSGCSIFFFISKKEA